MKRPVAQVLMVVCITVIAATITAYSMQHRPPPVGAVVVLELFTSEGCSSCPPADELLAKIVKESRDAHRRVYPLAFHVDSWNQANWSDPFSAAEYTRREEAYYTAHVSDGVYTPQMIINGTKAAIGSDNQVIRDEMNKALQRAATVDLKLSVTWTGDDRLVAQVDLSLLPTDGVLNVALVERGLCRHVPMGENAGRTLRHENVVRAYVTAAITQSRSTVTLPIPHDAVAGNCLVIAYAQNSKFWVLGATEADIPAVSSMAATSRP